MADTPLPSYATFQAGNVLVKLKGTFVNIYDDEGLAAITGITQVVGKPPAGSQTVSLQSAISSGILRRAKVRLNNKKIRDVYFLAANAPQVGALVGNNYGSAVINSAYFPRHFTFG